MAIGGLYAAASGLFAHRRRLDVISHNVANVNTTGYSKQNVDLKSEAAVSTGVWTGSKINLDGVTVTGITRSRDVFLEVRHLAASADFAEADTNVKFLSQIEQVFAEPSEDGIASTLDELWASFDDVSNFPDMTPQRSSLLIAAETVANRLREADTHLRDIRVEAEAQIDTIAESVNRLASEIASINETLAASGRGSEMNGLLDQRDMALSELAGLIGIRSVERENGTIDVYSGNASLVVSDRTFTMEVSHSPDPVLTPMGLTKIEATIGGVTVRPAAGELGGALSAANVDVPAAILTLDDIATTLIGDVNAVHLASQDLNGDPGVAFFTGTSAADIEVNSVVAADPAKVAAAGSGAGVRDGSAAAALADLRNSSTGADSKYETLVLTLGAETAAAMKNAGAYEQTAMRVDDARLAARAVSLDEEMVDMVEAQRAYEASARVINVMDEVLDLLINRLGTFGR